jgi:hypothetical protein
MHGPSSGSTGRVQGRECAGNAPEMGSAARRQARSNVFITSKWPTNTMSSVLENLRAAARSEANRGTSGVDVDPDGCRCGAPRLAGAPQPPRRRLVDGLAGHKPCCAKAKALHSTACMRLYRSTTPAAAPHYPSPAACMPEAQALRARRIGPVVPLKLGDGGRLKHDVAAKRLSIVAHAALRAQACMCWFVWVGGGGNVGVKGDYCQTQGMQVLLVTHLRGLCDTPNQPSSHPTTLPSPHLPQPPTRVRAVWDCGGLQRTLQVCLEPPLGDAGVDVVPGQRGIQSRICGGKGEGHRGLTVSAGSQAAGRQRFVAAAAAAESGAECCGGPTRQFSAVHPPLAAAALLAVARVTLRRGHSRVLRCAEWVRRPLPVGVCITTCMLHRVLQLLLTKQPQLQGRALLVAPLCC